MLMLPPMNAKFAKKTHAKTNVAVNLKKLEIDDKIIKITKRKTENVFNVNPCFFLFAGSFLLQWEQQYNTHRIRYVLNQTAKLNAKPSKKNKNGTENKQRAHRERKNIQQTHEPKKKQKKRMSMKCKTKICE